MKNGMSEQAFTAFKADRDAKLGRFVSRQVADVIQSSQYYIVIYDSVFEKEQDVIMRVVYSADEPHEVSGLVVQ